MKLNKTARSHIHVVCKRLPTLQPHKLKYVKYNSLTWTSDVSDVSSCILFCSADIVFHTSASRYGSKWQRSHPNRLPTDRRELEANELINIPNNGTDYMDVPKTAVVYAGCGGQCFHKAILPVRSLINIIVYDCDIWDGDKPNGRHKELYKCLIPNSIINK